LDRITDTASDSRPIVTLAVAG